MKDSRSKRLFAAACAFAAFAAAADTLDVPKDATVQLDGETDYSETTLAMNGGTLDQNGVTAAFAGMTVADGSTNHFANSAETSSILTIGKKVEFSRGAALYIESGKWMSDGSEWAIGRYGSATNIFDISGDSTRFSVDRTVPWYFSDAAPAIVNFRGGETSFMGDKCVYLATHATYAGLVWNVSGGTHDFKDALNFYNGNAVVNISGGVLKPRYVWMGNAASSAGNTHTINVTGGTLEVNNEFCLRKTASSACNTFVNLDGGLTWAPKVYAYASTSGAKSTLSADGGSLRPNMSSAEFITGIDNFLLGEQGLTLNIGSYATTVPQDITGVKEGSSFGRLVKKGGATLKLAGAIADGIKVVDEEANLEINGSIGTGEIIASAGVVTINGTVGRKAKLTVDGGEIVVSPDATIDQTATISVPKGILRVQKSITVAGLDVDETDGEVICENGAVVTIYRPGLTIVFR